MAEQQRYSVVAGAPSPQRYYDLRKITGLTPPPADLVAAEKGLANTWYGVMVIDTESSEPNDVVGMGRLTGDGALFLSLSDIAVHPDHQGKGLARLIMEKLLAYVDEHAPAAYTSLIGDPPAHERVYPKYSFLNASPSVGMYRWSPSRAKELAQDTSTRWPAVLGGLVSK